MQRVVGWAAYSAKWGLSRIRFVNCSVSYKYMSLEAFNSFGSVKEHLAPVHKLKFAIFTSHRYSAASAGLISASPPPLLYQHPPTACSSRLQQLAPADDSLQRANNRIEIPSTRAGAWFFTTPISGSTRILSPKRFRLRTPSLSVCYQTTTTSRPLLRPAFHT